MYYCRSLIEKRYNVCVVLARTRVDENSQKWSTFIKQEIDFFSGKQRNPRKKVFKGYLTLNWLFIKMFCSGLTLTLTLRFNF